MRAAASFGCDRSISFEPRLSRLQHGRPAQPTGTFHWRDSISLEKLCESTTNGNGSLTLLKGSDRNENCSQYKSVCNKEAAVELPRTIVRRHECVRKLSNK